jgi:hypothetical protein
MATSSLPPKLPLSALTATSVQTTVDDAFLMAPGIIEDVTLVFQSRTLQGIAGPSSML